MSLMSDSLKEQPPVLQQDEMEMSARWTALGNTLLRTANLLNAAFGGMGIRLQAVKTARWVIDTLSADWEGVSCSFQEFDKSINALFDLCLARMSQLEDAMSLRLDLVTDDQVLIGEILCSVDAQQSRVAASLARELRERAADCELYAANECLRVISDHQAEQDLLAEEGA